MGRTPILVRRKSRLFQSIELLPPSQRAQHARARITVHRSVGRRRDLSCEVVGFWVKLRSILYESLKINLPVRTRKRDGGLEAKLGIDKNRLYDLIHEAVDGGLMRKVGHGRYELIDEPSLVPRSNDWYGKGCPKGWRLPL